MSPIRISMAAALAATAVALLAPSLALAAEPCPKSFAEAVEQATPGSTVVAPAGTCAVNIETTNTAAFTIVANPAGTTLTAALGTHPIIRSSVGVRFTISGITFTGTEDAPAIELTGPGEAITLTHDTFTDLNSNDGGGAVEITPGAATTAQPTVLEADTFGAVGHGNTASNGGAVALIGSSRFIVRNNTFVANGATNPAGGGGGLVVENFSGSDNPVTVSGNLFGGEAPGAGNTSIAAGGGAAILLGEEQTLSLDGNSFIGNRISGESEFDRFGGGLALGNDEAEKEGAFAVEQSHNTFRGNVIDASEKKQLTPIGAGGAGEWARGVSVTSTDDEFLENAVDTKDGRTPEGGGLGVEGSNQTTPGPQGGTFVAVNDLFAGNTVAAGGWGGAIYSGGFSVGCPFGVECVSHLTLENSTVTANSIADGGEGGAIWGGAGDTLTVENSIVFGNTPAPETHGFATASFASSDACAAPGAAESGPGEICAEPRLAPDGSETSASPTIDAGSGSLVPAGVATDIAGAPRVLPGRCGDAAVVDMGAFELAAPQCPPAGTATGGAAAQRAPRASIGRVIATRRGVSVRVRCAGNVDQTCAGALSLLTTVHRRGGRIVAVSRAGSRSTVSVGGRRFAIRGGTSLTLPVVLNPKGRGLLARLHRLPVRVLATADGSPRSQALATVSVVIRDLRRSRR
jgi:hypothetical protein